MNYSEYVMYFILIILVVLMVILPRKRQEQQIQKMQQELKVGDRIITYSGIIGEVIAVNQEEVIVKTEPDGLKFTIEKWAIMEIKE